MKNYQKIISVFVLISSLTALNCAKKNEFSLARSGQNAQIEDCEKKLNSKKYADAVACFEAYRSISFGENSSADASLGIADAYFLKKEYLVAAESYQMFIKTNPNHPKLDYAYYRMGLSYFKADPKTIDRDHQYLNRAIEAFTNFSKFFPDSAYAQMAQDYAQKARYKAAAKEFYIGRFYFRFKQYLSAVERFENVISLYANAGFDEQSFYYLTQALKKTNQQDLANEYFEVFKKHYPNSPYVKKIASLLK